MASEAVSPLFNDKRFGSRCAIRHAVVEPSVAAVVAIGLPVKAYDLGEDLARLAAPLAVVQAGEDEFGTPEEVRGTLRAAGVEATIATIPAATHLLPGRAAEAAAAVVEAAARLLGATRAG